MAELTPMMKQYQEIKAQYQDCILFFRLGDFYEMFAEDARLAARELDLTLTTRDRDKSKSDEDRVPMCGVPFHAAESYIARLVTRGYKVAICEQMEDPALAKGLVKRDIIRIVTPGSVTESSMLDESRNNYLACIFPANGRFGLSFCDVSTGACAATLLDGADAEEKAASELGRFAPAEVLCSAALSEFHGLQAVLRDRLHCCVDVLEDEAFDEAKTAAAVEKQFGKSLDALGIADAPEAVRACGALLTTLQSLQKSDLSHIHTLDFYRTDRFMELDLTARRNLELTETLRSKEKRGSLLWVLDKTKTAMGSRLLRSWMEKPLLNPAQIERRLAAVDELSRNTIAREELILLLREVSDLERTEARIVTGTGNCRDFVALAAGAAGLPAIAQQAGVLKSPLLQSLFSHFDDLKDLRELIAGAIVDEPPFTVREGGMIRKGYSREADELREIMTNSKGLLARIEAQEKEKTGIKNLRIGYNRVFGYYIEVAKSQTGLVPDSYIRKQTLANGERYITQELKELETTILSAKDRLVALEYELFSAIREHLAAQHTRILKTANAIAVLDVLCCFAAVAVKNHYVRPEIDLSGEIQITAGRHPVVEQVLKNALFVPNDTSLSTEHSRVAILTGPNMAGKSTYMRQVALIVLMAQIGCFVPAKSARIGICDRIFTRIGASDDLASGQSTFMVEMTEVAEILRHATPRSLLILDEIGRGTSTFDGMAIARAVLEYAADPKKIGAKTLFATHYHELTAIEAELPGVKNYNIAVKKRGGEVVFLRKIVPGAADDSYGVEVAKLAGLPDGVIRRARTILSELEAGAPERPAKKRSDAVEEASSMQISMESLQGSEICARLQALNVETLTPIEAMNALYQLKSMLK